MKSKFPILLALLLILTIPCFAAGEELNVFADAWNSEMNPSFEKAYPDAAVHNSLEEATYTGFDQMLVGLLTGENSYDMFYLRLSTGRAKTLSDRGYLADLGQSGLITPDGFADAPSHPRANQDRQRQDLRLPVHAGDHRLPDGLQYRSCRAAGN